MFIINKDAVSSVRENLKAPSTIERAVEDIKRMIDIKSTLTWRADCGSCCGSLSGIASYLNRETTVLKSALDAVEEGNLESADVYLREYEHMMETSCEPAEPEHC